MDRNYNFLPMALPFFLILFFILILLFPILFFLYAGSIVAVFAKLGLSPAAGYSLFWLVLFGSMVNIPVKKVESESGIVQQREVYFYGMRYIVPDIKKKEMVIAVNLGGAIIPTLLSLYELVRLIATGRIWMFFASLIAVIAVAAVCHHFAKPVKGVGIAIPTFIPPITAVIIALILSFHSPAIIAYVGGTLGTLIGADLMNLNRITDLGAPVASIGGAGTFDGIFLTGILAVLLV
jgi:uncharacterized membrane protein